jgi:DNA-binding PadR family transcriptional regulator
MRVLYEKPMHGYQLLEEIEKTSQGCHKLETGSVYTLLRRMEERGLVKSKWEKVEGGLDRRVYMLTDKGVEALKMGLITIVKRKKLFEDLVNFYYENFKTPVKKGGEKGNV